MCLPLNLFSVGFLLVGRDPSARIYDGCLFKLPSLRVEALTRVRSTFEAKNVPSDFGLSPRQTRLIRGIS